MRFDVSPDKLFRESGAYRLVLEVLFNHNSGELNDLIEETKLSRRLVQKIIERGINCRLFRIVRPGVYQVTGTGMNLIGKTGGLMYPRSNGRLVSQSERIAEGVTC